jgi:hypothetical protein
MDKDASGQGSAGGDAAEKLSKASLEKRRFERLRANLQIHYRVAKPEELTALAAEDYVAPGDFKATTVEMSDFKKLTTEEVVVGENISQHGVKISVAHPVKEGTRLLLRISIPGAPLPMHAIGEVRWCRSSGTAWNAGLKFVGISKADMARMELFLERQKRPGEGVGPGKPVPEAAEKRSAERLQARIDIKYRVVDPEEEAEWRKNDYAAPEGFSPDSPEAPAFSALANDEVVVSEDISLGGLKISVSKPVTEGMKLLLQVSIPGVPIPVNAIGEVRWCQEVGDLWNAGLRFLGLSKADLDRVDRFLLLQKRAQMAKRA